MNKVGSSTKRNLIGKDNSTILFVMAVASFITVFSLVACRSLISQSQYQSRVIKSQRKAQNQLKANLAAVKTLESSYKDFVGTSENLFGAPTDNASGAGIDNGQIVLDALPSKYDFPALTSSLEKILTSGGYSIEGITGTDNEAAAVQTSGDPAPVEMPFQLATSGSYESIQTLVQTFHRSIRPFVVTSFELSGADNKLRISLTAKTFYQPEKKVENKTEVVK